MGTGLTGLGGRVTSLWLMAVLAVVAAQSAAHLELTLGQRRVGTVLDLERSNSLPDLVSTLILALAAAGAVALAGRERGRRRALAASLGSLLALLVLADVTHDGPHVSSVRGATVIGLVVAVGVLLALVALPDGWWPRALVAAAVLVLCGSFLVTALDNVDAGRFERAGGDPIAEYEIVVKHGLELLGWSLVALALSDVAFRRRPRSRQPATARASRARAASRRRAA